MNGSCSPRRSIVIIVLTAVMAVVLPACENTSKTADDGSQGSGDGPIILAEHDIRLGMTIPGDGRTLVGVIDASTLPAGGFRFGYVTGQQQQCICICRNDGNNTCTPAGCPDTCPVPFCPDGTFPPCDDGGMVIPDLRGLLGPPVGPDGPLDN